MVARKVYARDIRSTLDFLKKEGEILTVKKEVDPDLEISGIQKAMENSYALLFENIKGFPGIRVVGNLFSRKERIAKIFNIENPNKIKFDCVEALRHPLSAKEVKIAPCQENIVTNNINPRNHLPIGYMTEKDGGRIMGSGVVLLSGKYFRGGTHVSFNRINFRGKDWGSLETFYPTHLGTCIWQDFKGEKVPITVNICPPPAVWLVAASGLVHAITPDGCDELGFAGRLQSTPVEIIKAKTVEAYAIARSEWVIEGYIDTTQLVWETDDAEKEGKLGVAPFWPEWPGYLGKAYKSFKFQATALTHRRDSPLFAAPQAYSWDNDLAGSAFREACYYELAERIAPGLVVDVNILPGIAAWGGNIIFQVKKRRRPDEGYQRNILVAALGVSQGLRLAVVVDEDVDIYSADDILWAIATRVDPNRDIIRGSIDGAGFAQIPAERVSQRYEGGLGFDATVPYEHKEKFERAHYPTDKVDLKQYFTEAELQASHAQQCDYARLQARRGG